MFKIKKKNGNIYAEIHIIFVETLNEYFRTHNFKHRPNSASYGIYLFSFLYTDILKREFVLQ